MEKIEKDYKQAYFVAKNRIENQASIVKELRHKLNNAKKKLSSLQVSNNTMSRKLSKINVENAFYTCVNSIIHQNNGFGASRSRYNLMENHDDFYCSMGTVVKDFELAFIYFKLFETHLCDRVIDILANRRILSYVKDDELFDMFCAAKLFSRSVGMTLLFMPGLKVKELHDTIKKFLDGQLDDFAKLTKQRVLTGENFDVDDDKILCE